jgi:hypothetical protein
MQEGPASRADGDGLASAPHSRDANISNAMSECPRRRRRRGRECHVIRRTQNERWIATLFVVNGQPPTLTVAAVATDNQDRPRPIWCALPGRARGVPQLCPSVW